MSSRKAAQGGLAIGRRGLMLVLSSPSGAGKTAICQGLRDGEELLAMSVSVTTRPRRSAEVDGVDYRFVDADTFERMVQRDEFLENATVFGQRYGTPREPVASQLKAGRDVLFDVDWQGARKLSELAGDDVVGVFILPPSAAELERRLKSRAQDPEHVVAERMARSADEISHWVSYDYVIVNEDLAVSVNSVRAILHAERLRRTRQVGVAALVDSLIEER